MVFFVRVCVGVYFDFTLDCLNRINPNSKFHSEKNVGEKVLENYWKKWILVSTVLPFEN